ncbi:DUF4835 family protein [Flavobacterium sp.]|uniref:type IX secretion system protein PorD n=1 Tax=Flavobacterium sp. TaxID=239 RepID=UPI002629533C|nr:DUF4835 family protein [Flavobacterium sp.]
MRKILFFLLFATGISNAQELNCEVRINSDRVGSTNQQIFKTLEKSLNEFVNKTKWTETSFKTKERIDCTMFINVASYSGDQFSATLQIQSSRPVYNSTYSSPVFNYNDKDFNFKYVEYENLFFNPNSFDSNLVSVLAFYANIIIGLDADTYSLMGGTDYFNAAQSIASVAQQGGYKGWSQQDGNQNRFFLINDLLSNTFAPIREALYDYHIGALDVFGENTKAGKEKIKATLMTLQKVYDTRPNAFLTRVFFDSKADEIVSIFSAGPSINIADLTEMLNKLSPVNSSKWSSIKF